MLILLALVFPLPDLDLVSLGCAKACAVTQSFFLAGALIDPGLPLLSRIGNGLVMERGLVQGLYFVKV